MRNLPLLLLCLLFAGCSLGTDIDELRARVGGDKQTDSLTDSFTVTFDSNGGSLIPKQTVESGGTATRPVNPPYNGIGYDFDDWYYDEELTIVYDFSTPVTENITLYAKWNNIPVSGDINIPFIGPTETNISITRVITNNFSKSGGGSITLTINENFDRYEWFVGTTNVASGNNVILQASDTAFITGHNWITAVVYTGTGANAIPWSGEFLVYVSE